MILADERALRYRSGSGMSNAAERFVRFPWKVLINSGPYEVQMPFSSKNRHTTDYGFNLTIYH